MPTKSGALYVFSIATVIGVIAFLLWPHKRKSDEHWPGVPTPLWETIAGWVLMGAVMVCAVVGAVDIVRWLTAN